MFVHLRARDPLWTASVVLSLALSLWLFWPTLHDGLYADDFLAEAMLNGSFAVPRGPLDLFNFADGTTRDVSALKRLGSLPWWSPPDLRIAFLRPLSSALWHVDRALFGEHYGAYHAHSLLVFALLVIASAALYRKLLPSLPAALATLMFALDDSHHFPVVWLSNRGGIYASLFGVLALLAHLQWRTRGQLRYALLSAGAVCIALAFGEWALPMLAYIAAYELLGAEDSWRKRALALLPSALPAAVFLVLRAALQYGARGSGAYIDPGVDAKRFLFTVLHRIPTFVADMIWNTPSEWWDHGTPWRDAILSRWLIPPRVWAELPSWHFFQLALGVLGLAAIGFGLRFCAAGLSAAERRTVRWMLLGSLGALVPVVGSFASTRLTIAAFLGLTPLMALVLREVGRRLRAAARLRPLGFAGYYLIVLAIVHNQFYEPLQANVEAQVDHYATASQWVLGAELDPALVPKQRVILLAGSEFTTTFYFAYIWAHHGRPLPAAYYPITSTPCAHYVERVGPNELVLRALGGYYLESGAENMFRSPERIWREQESTVLGDDVRITAEQVTNGVPGVLRLTFARPLDDPSYVFLIAVQHGLVRFHAPPLGQQMLLARASDPSWTAMDRFRYVMRVAPLPHMLSYTTVPGFVLYDPAR